MELPKEVGKILDQLREAGFEAYIVGGCVRDILLSREPRDWDVTTNASPEEIQKVFPKNFYNNKFGTVTVLTTPSNSPLSGGEATQDSSPDKGRLGGVSEIEVTTYRVDGDYSDNRRPDKVEFTSSLKDDLARRDFTINAIAAASQKKMASEQKAQVVVDGLEIFDPFGGLKDLNEGIIKAVGDPSRRFEEDALRLMRAVRLAAELDLALDDDTQDAIKLKASSITAVSEERVRDELIKIISSKNPTVGLELLRKTDLLEHILPEVAEGIGVEQNKHHIFSVYEHNIKSMQFAADFDYEFAVRLAALLHDVGKPKTRRLDKAQSDYTFYGHDIVGSRMAKKLMKRLKFSSDLTEKVSHLVRYHMFYYDVGKVTEAGARRLLKRVGGPEKFADLIKLRIAERKGSGVPKAEPYRLRHLQFLVEKAAQEPISVNQLAINGGDLIKDLKMKPGPQIGGILNALLAQVLEDPKKNDKKYLLEQAVLLQDKDVAELKKMGADAMEEEELKREEDIKRKYHV